MVWALLWTNYFSAGAKAKTEMGMRSGSAVGRPVSPRPTGPQHEVPQKMLSRFAALTNLPPDNGCPSDGTHKKGAVASLLHLAKTSKPRSTAVVKLPSALDDPACPRFDQLQPDQREVAICR